MPSRNLSKRLSELRTCMKVIAEEAAKIGVFDEPVTQEEALNVFNRVYPMLRVDKPREGQLAWRTFYNIYMHMGKKRALKRAKLHA